MKHYLKAKTDEPIKNRLRLVECIDHFFSTKDALLKRRLIPVRILQNVRIRGERKPPNALTKKYVLFLFLLTTLFARSMNAQEILSQFDGFNTNGAVRSVTVDESNDLIYLGGDFTRINGKVGGAAIDKVTGTASSLYPEINGIGSVAAAVSDGAGGFYIGGNFTSVGGLSRKGLAHIDATGTVTDFNPGGTPSVFALARSGNILYVGGSFSVNSGLSRNRIASFDLTTGAVTNWQPTHTMTQVNTITVDGSSVYFGGTGGSFQLAEADATTGAINWSTTSNSSILSSFIHNDILYAGGIFTEIDGESRSRLAAFDLTNNNGISFWDPSPNNAVYGIDAIGATIYIAGGFTSVGGTARQRIAGIVESTGALTAFNPSIPVLSSSGVEAILIDGDQMYLGSRNFIVLTISTETVTMNDPVGSSSSSEVRAIAYSDNDIYVGGQIQSIGGTLRTHVAALNMTAGSLASFSSDIDGTVYSMILDGSDLYIAGGFQNAGGQSRNAIASINKTTGNATSWDPNIQRLAGSAEVRKILKEGSLIYAGGDFTSIGSDTRFMVGAIDISTGNATAWAPNTSDLARVNDIAIDGDTFYAGGTFTNFGGQTRRRIAAVDKTTGVLSDWDQGTFMSTGDEVLTIAIGNDSKIYVGGDFNGIGGQTRSNVAALDPATAQATTWNPSPNNDVNELLVSAGGTIYVAGIFSNIDGESRRAIATFKESDGSIKTWNPSIGSQSVYAIQQSGSNVYLGGNFPSILGTNNANFAGLTRSPEAPSNLTLSNSSIAENEPVGTAIGDFMVVDEANDTHTYALVSGAGGSGNFFFSIDGSSLKSAAVLDFETAETRSVRVAVTDSDGNSIEEVFTINVSNVIETGTDITSFVIPDQVGLSVIDDTNHTVLIDMGSGTDISSLNPAIAVSSGATISPVSGTSQNFNSPITYTVTAENGTTQDWTVTVIRKLQAGTYSVGSAADYTSVVTALEDVEDNGISGDVIFEIEDGYSDSWNSAVIFDDFDGTDDHSVTITVADGATSASILPSNSSFLIRDVKNFTIDGKGVLEIQSPSAANGATIQILQNFTSMVAPENIEIKNTKFKTQRSAIVFSTASNVSVSGCEFSFLDNSGTNGGYVSSVRMISVDGATIYNNKVQYVGAFDQSASSSFGSLHGIDAQTSNNDISIYNNSIHLNPISAKGVVGIHVSSATTERLIVDHNTIFIEGSNNIDGTSDGIRATANTGSKLRVRNNLISLKRDNLNGDEHGITYSTVTDRIVSYNTIFITDDAGTEDYVNNLELADLETILIDAPGTTVTQPIFSDPSSNDLALSGVSLSDADFRGIPIAEITNDLDGDIRSTLSPSKGAYEVPNIVTDINSFTFAGIDGEATIDEANHTVDAIYLDGTDVTDITPTIDIIAGASINPSSGVTQDFTSSVTYTVTAEDGNTQDWIVSITDGRITWDGTEWSNTNGPTATDDVVIDGRYTFFSNGSFECEDLVVTSEGELYVNSAGTLEVSGDISNDGLIRILNGSSLITYDGHSVIGNPIEIRRETRYADGKYSFVSSPIEQNASVIGSDLGLHVYIYNEAASSDPNALSRWISAATDELVPGRGYTQANKQLLLFEGVPNNGTINYTATATNDGYHLVGNPYPAAIDVDAFIDGNSATTETIYIWDDNGSDTERGSNSDYIVVTKSGATDNNGPDSEARWNGYIGSMQGFFVQMDGSAGTVSFTEDMRVNGNNADANFYRTSNSRNPLARINLTNEEGLFKQTLIAWNDEVTDTELAKGYDGKVFGTSGANMLYTMKDDHALAIQTVTRNKEVIPLTYQVEKAGVYTIQVNLEEAQGQSLYLRDKKTEEVTVLNNKGYSFITNAGQFADRFELFTNARILGLDVNKIQVYAHDQTIYINQPEGEERTYQLWSIDGQQVFTRKLRSSAEIQTNLSPGVYIISDGEQSHKIILK